MSSVIVESTVIRPPLSPPADEADPPTEPEASPTSKRPHSPPPDRKENGETTSKRRRLSSDQERGKRLFGGLMRTLTTFQKQSEEKGSKLARTVEKRAEIEARIKERVEKEKEIMEANKEVEQRERKEKEEFEQEQLLKEIRRTQDSGLLQRAYHLHTKGEPKIYYRPYILTPEQKDLIEEQVSQAQARIESNEPGSLLSREPVIDEATRDEGEEDRSGEGEDPTISPGDPVTTAEEDETDR